MALKRSNQRTIQQLTHFESIETVRRHQGEQLKEVTMDGKDVVPGDIIKIQGDWVVPCDIVLLDGTVVVDEAGLTGESMPVAKVAASLDSDKQYGAHGSSRFTLYAGTTVLQVGGGPDSQVWGMVMSTGINTQKGDLVAHILRPGTMLFKYDEEYIVCFTMLLLYGVFLFTMTIVFMDINETNAHNVIKFLKGVFTCSQMLPPLLPLTLIVGQAASAARLQAEMSIFCVNPKRISICGKVRLCCFDKTGTLTKDGLDFLGVVPINEGSFDKQIEATDAPETLMKGLATCHAVTAYQNGFVGNQVEVKMFEATGWNLPEVPSGETVTVEHGGVTVMIPKRFEFDHARMCMSVITNATAENRIYCKGAAEKIEQLCDNLPKDFLQVAQRYAKEGCYVLGLATRKLDQETDFSTLSRDDVESPGSMECLGLILFRNELKPDTAAAIKELKEGDTRTVMITGDNAQCGYYIARESGMIERTSQVWLATVGDDGVVWDRQDVQEEETKRGPEITGDKMLPEDYMTDPNIELAVTGKALENLKQKAEFDNLLLKIRIFARVSPNQKTDIVERFIRRGLTVAMCGDGGNDCGALRAAHVGLSLSEAEASVVSPFTSQKKTVMSMVDLLREGRCALATSFATWKFMITFGQGYALAKFGNIYHDTIISSMGYIFMDIGLIVSITFVLPLSRPLDKLGKERPTASLLGPHTIGSIMGITFINFFFVIIGWAAIIYSADNYQEWPIKCEDGSSWWLMGDNWEATYTFVTFTFQIFTCGFLYALGTRFRKPVWTNYILVVLMMFYVIFFTSLILVDRSPTTEVFHYATENHNRYQTPSTTWQFYQNVNEEGLPKVHTDSCGQLDGSCQWEPNQSQTLYEMGEIKNTTEGAASDAMMPGYVLLPSGNYVPGVDGCTDYDQCVYNACTAPKKKPGCACGKED
eukprot:UN30965